LSKRGGAKLKKLAHTDSLTQAEWLEFRRGGIGGSDISTIFNLNEWKSPTYLYMEKRGEIEPDDLSDNESVYWGNALEDLIRKEFQKRNGWKVQRNNFVLCHDTYDYLRANIDGEIIHPEDGRGVLEIKTTNEYSKDEWSGDHVPNAYMLQIQYYMGIMNYGFAYVAVLIGGNKYRQWRIERDNELIEMIFARKRCRSIFLLKGKKRAS
jgi:putative phage-type endonuclease